MPDYKKRDSKIKLIGFEHRLTEDARPVGTIVKLKTVFSSRQDRYTDTWLEITPRSWDMDMSRYLRKNDIIDFIGMPASRTWGDNNDKTSFECYDTEIIVSPELIGKLKERGWVPGAAKEAVKTTKPAAKAPLKAVPKARPIVDPDDDDL